MKNTVLTFKESKKNKEKITMLTAKTEFLLFKRKKKENRIRILTKTATTGEKIALKLSTPRRQ